MKTVYGIFTRRGTLLCDYAGRAHLYERESDANIILLDFDSRRGYLVLPATIQTPSLIEICAKDEEVQIKTSKP